MYSSARESPDVLPSFALSLLCLLRSGHCFDLLSSSWRCLYVSQIPLVWTYSSG